MPQPADNPVWDEPRLRDPHAVHDKARRVREMFGAIVDSYDLNNRVHSLGLDQRWRRATARLAGIGPDDRVLDVACGTADLLLAARRRGSRRLIGVDFCGPMLTRARAKLARSAGRPEALLAAGDAMALPLADQSVDVITIAFGLRNVADPSKALSEFARVLRPGGRLAVLEFSMPAGWPWRGLYEFYFTRIMPRLATWISGDRTGAYRYLPHSVLSFMGRADLLAAMSRAGLADARAVPLTLGVAVVYLASRPGDRR